MINFNKIILTGILFIKSKDTSQIYIPVQGNSMVGIVNMPKAAIRESTKHPEYDGLFI